MQELTNLQVKELNDDTVIKTQELYESFASRAAQDYKLEFSPIKFDQFKDLIKENLMHGLVIFEDSLPVGFLLYVIEDHKAVELNVIHLIENKDSSKRKKALIKALQDKLKEKTDWKVISYPMLGIQDSFVKEIALFGFKLIGQSVVKFDLKNSFSIDIYNKAKLSALPEGYSIVSWKDEYFNQAAQVIHDTFKTASDSNFDPRFLSLEGSQEVVFKITSGLFGDFLPEATSVLLFNDRVEGVCFANIPNISTANVPLVGIRREHKNKGFGKYLLKNTISGILEQVKDRIVLADKINAAVETDNFPALKMYRRIGFREDYTYPHSYYNNPDFKE